MNQIGATYSANQPPSGELHDRSAREFLVDDAPSPEQVTLLRNMTGAQRLALAEALFWEARELKAAGVRHRHPDWSAEQVMTEVDRIFLNAWSGAGVRKVSA